MERSKLVHAKGIGFRLFRAVCRMCHVADQADQA